MNKIQFSGRPFVYFDPRIKEHRTWFADFCKGGTWGKCPVRFIVQDDVGDLVSMIQRKLISYYMAKEFKHSVL